MARRHFLLLLVTGLGLLAFMAGFFSGGEGSVGGVGVGSGLWPPRPDLVRNGEHVRGPNRALQDKETSPRPLPVAVASTEGGALAPALAPAPVNPPRPPPRGLHVLPPAQKSPPFGGDSLFSSDEINEIKRVIEQGDIKRTDKAVSIRQRARNRLIAMNRMRPKLGPRYRSLFSFASLSKEPSSPEHPKHFALSHLRSRLTRELSLGQNDTEEVYKLLTQKEPSKKLPEIKESDKAHRLTVGNSGALNVGSAVPSVYARQILIATTWRSGSSFFGDLLGHYPGAFYSFEPLHSMNQEGQDDINVPKSVELLRALFKCKGSPESMHYLRHCSKSKNNFLFDENFRYWKLCQFLLPGKAGCFLPEVYNSACELFPVRIAKTVRLRLHDAKELLDDPELPNIKIVLLVRDPRGTMNSRASMEWCVKAKCANATVACQHLDQDVTAAKELSKLRPDKIHLVRYEDLSVDPYETVRELLNFLDLPNSSTIDDFIETHTKTKKLVSKVDKRTGRKKQVVNPYQTVRDSKSTAFAWKAKMDMGYIRRIQDKCQGPMDTLGYNRIDSPEQRDDPDFPVVVKGRHEVWEVGSVANGANKEGGHT